MFLVGAPILALVYFLERKLGTRQTWFTPVWKNLNHILDHWTGRLLIFGAILLVMGIFFAVKDLGRGPLTPLSVKELEQGRVPQSTYVELVDGKILEDSSFRFTSNKTTYRYIPVVAHADQPVLFLRITDKKVLRSDEKIRGLLDRDGLEGELRSQLESAHTIGSPHYVLGIDLEPDPASGGWMAFIGLSLCAIGLVCLRSCYRTQENHPERSEKV
jgi:hypothetical protein